MYYARYFKTLEEAKNFQKKKGGVLYKNTPRSRTRKDHLLGASALCIDPVEYPFSVHWTLPKGEFEY